MTKNSVLTTLALLFVVSTATLAACDDDKGQTSTDASSTPDLEQQGAELAGEADSDAPDGGTSPEDATTDTERREATSAEKATITEKPPLAVDNLLTTDDAREMAPESMKSAPYTATRLPGRKASPTYNARRIYPEDLPSEYGIGVQVWTFESADEASSKLADLESQYLNVSELDGAPDELQGDSFQSKRGNIRSVLFTTEEPAGIISFSCSTTICDSWEPMYVMSSKLASRLKNRREPETKGQPEEQTNSEDEAGEDQQEPTSDEGESEDKAEEAKPQDD